jgi:hypothetical protein
MAGRRVAARALALSGAPSPAMNGLIRRETETQHSDDDLKILSGLFEILHTPCARI